MTDAQAEIADFVLSDDDEETCPVQVLGVDGKGKYWYVAAAGRITGLTAAQHNNQANLDALFGGQKGVKWLTDIPHFVKWDRGRADGYKVALVRQWLMALADQQPPFSPDRHIRKKGIWLDDRDRIVLHCGDKLFVNQIPGKPGRRLDTYEGAGPYVYPLDTADPYPDFDHPAPASEFHDLLATIAKWNFEDGDAASRIVLGWIINAILCGVVPWRSHMLLTGAPGTGKSTLLDLILAVFGPGGIVSSDDATEAYIRQALDGARKAIVLDEIENDEEAWRGRKIVKAARNSSKAREGGGAGRGSAEGVAHQWLIVSTFLFTSVDPIPLNAAERTRITPIRLRPIKADAKEVQAIQAAIAGIKKRGPNLRGRVIDRAFLDRYLVNLRIYQDALAAEGCSARLCDQMGAFLAGSDAALFDDPVAAGVAADIVAALAAQGLIDEAAQTDSADDCLARLLSWPAKVYRDGPGVEEMALGELVGMTYRNDSTHYTRALRRYGLAWKADDTDSLYLCVAVSATELERIYQGTRWAGGGWTESLRRLDRAHAFKVKVWLAGTSQRATWLEPRLVLEQSTMDDADERHRQEQEAAARRNQGIEGSEGMGDE